MGADPGDTAEPTPRRKHAAAEKIVRTLQDRGHLAYLAGGCVRDMIMGREPSDYDVATDAPPRRVVELFRRAKLVGQAFGVVRVCVEGEWVEVATFRTESGYADHRHPDHVEYSDAEHDAQRRDFTINGLFYDPVADRVIDYVGGRADIERRVLRAIGEPRQRFEEDYLRLLRAVRFAARLSFEIEPATAAAIRELAPRLGLISRERIGQEVQMMLEHPARAAAAQLTQQLHLDASVLDEPLRDEPTSQRDPIALASLQEPVEYPVALAAWAIDRHLDPHRPGTPAELTEALERMKPVALVRRWREALTLSNEHRDALHELFKGLTQAVRWPQLDTAQRKRLLARPDWPGVRQLLGATSHLLTREPLDLETLDREATILQAQGVAPSPLITGDDLIAAGFAPGPIFQPILEKVYDAQLSGVIHTHGDALDLARSIASAKKCDSAP